MSGDEEPVEVLTVIEVKKRLVTALSRQYDGNNDQAIEFINLRIRKLLDLLEKGEIELSSDEDEGLMNRLIEMGLFPSFSFPLDVATFEVKGTRKRAGSTKAKEYIYARTSQDLKVALSEFQPGKRLTINKQTFLVEGVGLKFPKHPISHLKELSLGTPRIQYDVPGVLVDQAKDWKYFHRCEAVDCGFIIASIAADWNIDGNETCPSCQAGDDGTGKLRSTRLVTPEVFRPRVVPFGNGKEYTKLDAPQNLSVREMRAPEDPEELAKRTRVGRATLPTPLTNSIEEEGFKRIDFDTSWISIEAFRFEADRMEEVKTEDKDAKNNEAAKLLLVNPGPKGDGFSICVECGFVDLRGSADTSHHRPYAILSNEITIYVSKEFSREVHAKRKLIDESESGDMKVQLEQLLRDFLLNEDEWKKGKFLELSTKSRQTCTGTFTNVENQTNVCLGMTFRTDIFLLRIAVEEPLNIQWKHPAFDAGFRAIKEALITEVTDNLELVNREISGNLRKVVVPSEDDPEVKNRFIDIYLFDNASGGAGLVREINSDRIMDILENVKTRLDGSKCVAQRPCSRVCIGCLLDFRNQREADRMDRRLGYQILSYLSNPDIGLDFRINDKSGIDEDLLDREIATLNDIYPTLKMKKKGHSNIAISKSDGTEEREIYVHSILEGTSAHPSDVISYNQTRTFSSDLENKVITMPYELIRDAPHMVEEKIYPLPDEDEDGFMDSPPPL